MTGKNGLWKAILMTAIFFTAVCCAGCGKKADPCYPFTDYPEAVSNLEVSLDKENVVLKWNIPEDLDYKGHVRILKSVVEPDDDVCPDCPHTYVVAGHIPLRDSRRDDQKKFVYLDRDIKSGFSYFYRVVICDSQDRCGEESNTVWIGIP